MPRLVVNPNSPTAFEIQLKPGPNFIGRGFANDFKIPDPSVSGSHCQILVSDSSVLIKDLNSTNGTFVERAPVQEAVLQPGQAVRLGNVEMLYYADGPQTATAIPAPAPPPIQLTAPAPSPAPAAPARPPGLRLAAAAPVTAAEPVATPPPPLKFSVPPPSTATAALATAPTVTATSASPAMAPGSGQCKFHPKSPGRLYCPKCSHYFCELCVTSRSVGAAQHKFCRHCGAECLPAQVQLQRPGAEKSFFAQLPQAFVYPVRGMGILMLMVGTVLMAAMKFMGPGKFTVAAYLMRGFSWGLVGQVFFFGYLFSYMQNIIFSTTAEETELPPLPTMSNMWEDIVAPSLKLFALMLVCFGPALAAEWWVISSENSGLGMTLIIPVYILGGLYFPMAFLAVAVLDSVAAANPLQVIPSILKVPLEYLVTVVLLALVFGVRRLGDEVIPRIFTRGLTTHNMGRLFGYLGAEAFWALMCLYLLTVAMHILGLLYLSKKSKLGWLAH